MIQLDFNYGRRVRVCFLSMLILTATLVSTKVQAGECKLCKSTSSGSISVLTCEDPRNDDLMDFTYRSCEVKCSGLIVRICFCLVFDSCRETPILRGPGVSVEAEQVRLPPSLIESLREVDPYVAALIDRPLDSRDFSGRIQPAKELHPEGFSAESFSYRGSSWVENGRGFFEIEIEGYPAVKRVSGELWANGRAVFLELEHSDGEVDFVHLRAPQDEKKADEPELQQSGRSPVAVGR